MIRIIFIFILIYIALKLFVKYIFPALLGNYINKKVSEMHKQQSYQNNNHSREGDVTIDAATSSKKKYSKNTGEYVDFEEVK